jgi:hypothetical protein
MTRIKRVKPFYLGVMVTLCTYGNHLINGMQCAAYPDMIPWRSATRT